MAEMDGVPNMPYIHRMESSLSAPPGPETPTLPGTESSATALSEVTTALVAATTTSIAAVPAAAFTATAFASSAVATASFATAFAYCT